MAKRRRHIRRASHCRADHHTGCGHALAQLRVGSTAGPMTTYRDRPRSNRERDVVNDQFDYGEHPHQPTGHSARLDVHRQQLAPLQQRRPGG